MGIRALLLVVGLATVVLAEPTPSNRFSFELFTQLAGKPGNRFLSGYSVRTALAMTHAGARGVTAREMEKVLHLDPAAVPAKLKASKEFQLFVANALWAQNGLTLEPVFLETMKGGFGAPLHLVDFRTQREAARQRINGWVEEQTKRRIRDLVPEGILGADTRLVLTNAIYFKAGWLHKFKKRATAPAAFRLEGGATVEVPTMRKVAGFRTAKVESLVLVELPYEGGATMVIAMPDDMTSFKIDADRVKAWEKALRGDRIDLRLPKFKTQDALDVAETLQAMGMKEAFSTRADFSGMTKSEPLMISNVLHKASIDVDENGTEAAAATAVIMKLGGARAPGAPRVVRIDRPFVFWIRHRASGEVLFLGRISDPR